MNKALLAVAGVVAAGGIYYVATQGPTSGSGDMSLPSLSKSELSTLIQSQKASYKTDGFNITEKDGVFSLTAKDEKKVRAFLFNKLTAMLPKSYSSSLQPLKQEFLASDQKIVAGLEFDMKVIDSKEGAKLEVVLTKLPTHLQKKLERDTKAQWFKELIDKGAFAYTLSMDKTGKVNGLAIKDIVEHIELPKTIIDTKLEGAWAKFSGDVNGKFKMQEAIKMISFNVKENNNFFGITVNNVKGNLDQTTLFDQTASSSIERIMFDMEKRNKFIKFLMNGVAFSSNTEDDNGFINSNLTMDTDKVDFKVTRKGEVKSSVILDGFKLSVTGKHISKEAALALQNVSTGLNPQKDLGKLQKALEKMVKTGLTLDVDALNVKKLAFGSPFLAFEVKDFTFNLHAQLKENSLDMNMGSPAQYIPFIKITARLALNNADLDKLVAMQPMAGMVTSMKVVEGELAVFNIVFEAGQIKVNGKPLPF